MDQEMLMTVIRFMVLAFFAMMSTNIVSLFNVLRTVIPGSHSDLIFRAMHALLTLIDETVNLLCLYLQFEFGKNLYSKYCYFVNSCFQSLFIKSLKIQNQTSNQNDNNNDDTQNTSNPQTNSNGVTLEMSTMPYSA